MRRRSRSQRNNGSGFSTAICHAAARFALRPLFMPAKGPPKGPQPLPRLCSPAADRVKGPLPLLSGVRLPGNRLAPPFRDSRGRLAPQARSGRRAGRPLPPEALGGFARAPGAFPAPLGQLAMRRQIRGGLAVPLRLRAFRRKLAYAAFISPSPSDFSQKSPHRLAHRHFPWYRVTRGCSVHTCLPICPLGRKESP